MDDEELDSGDDEGRTDRLPHSDDQREEHLETQQVMDIELERHPIPEPSDGEVYVFSLIFHISIY